LSGSHSWWRVSLRPSCQPLSRTSRIRRSHCRGAGLACVGCSAQRGQHPLGLGIQRLGIQPLGQCRSSLRLLSRQCFRVSAGYVASHVLHSDFHCGRGAALFGTRSAWMYLRTSIPLPTLYGKDSIGRVIFFVAGKTQPNLATITGTISRTAN
jgi:hypothetical protein